MNRNGNAAWRSETVNSVPVYPDRLHNTTNCAIRPAERLNLGCETSSRTTSDKQDTDGHAYNQEGDAGGGERRWTGFAIAILLAGNNRLLTLKN